MQESKGLFGGRPAGKTTGRTNYNQAKEFKRVPKVAKGPVQSDK